MLSHFRVHVLAGPTEIEKKLGYIITYVNTIRCNWSVKLAKALRLRLIDRGIGSESYISLPRSIIGEQHPTIAAVYEI